jgi:hypothetical protein
MMSSSARAQIGCALVMACACTLPLWAQWERHPTPNVPRTADGKIDLDAPPRRTAAGKVDLAGLWEPASVRYLLNIASDLKPGEVPLQPWAATLLQERIASNGRDHPGARCLPSGIPEKLSVPDGVKIVQTPDVTIFMWDSRTIFRQVFTDGRSFPKDPQPAWMGYSIGRWEGDAFVVETIGQNGKTWLDMRGHPATEALRVTERYTRPSVGRMNIAVTIDDPKAYTRPWNVNLAWRLLPDVELIESICEENNRDPVHIFGK